MKNCLGKKLLENFNTIQQEVMIEKNYDTFAKWRRVGPTPEIFSRRIHLRKHVMPKSDTPLFSGDNELSCDTPYTTRGSVNLE